jgi:hypothetical protein
MTCNQTLKDLLIKDIKQGFEEETTGAGRIATIFEAALSSAPVLGQFVVEADEAAEGLWITISAIASASAELLAGGTPVGVWVSTSVSTVIETALDSFKSRLVALAADSVEAEAIAGALATVTEIAVPLAAAVVAWAAGIVAAATVKATAEYLSQSDIVWNLQDQEEWLADPQGVAASFVAVQRGDDTAKSSIDLTTVDDLFGGTYITLIVQTSFF